MSTSTYLAQLLRLSYTADAITGLRPLVDGLAGDVERLTRERDTAEAQIDDKAGELERANEAMEAAVTAMLGDASAILERPEQLAEVGADLRARAETAKRERDDARREVCEEEAGADIDAAGVARRRGWGYLYPEADRLDDEADQ